VGSRFSPKIVGAFVIGALALIAVSVMLLGSGRLFRNAPEYVLYFQGSVNGLRVGAPVKVRGVPIGSVTQIRLSFDPAAEAAYRAKHRDEILIAVVIEVDLQQLTELGAIRVKELSDAEAVHEAVKRGLRAYLGTESLVTGLLFVSLDFRPATPAHLVLRPGAKELEIPTIPTALEQAQEDINGALSKLRKIDFEALFTSLTETLDALRQLVGSPRTQAVIDSLTRATDSLDKTSTSFRHLAESIHAEISPLSKSLQRTSDTANLALKQAQQTLATMQTTVDPESPLGFQIRETLAQLSEAARQVRELAELLQRNPSAIVRGKATKGAGQ
jgi:phospholipid/cholesterol/gamma-HCH transport system substrate-binding protein